MEMLFEEFRPQLVFHAAAHKHVPLMEDSPTEAVKNNVFGTYNVAKLAEKFNVEKFILVSTDKGKKLFDSVKNQLEIRESTIENALQPSLVKPATMPQNYSEFTADFEANGFEYVSKKYKLVPPMKKLKRKINFPFHQLKRPAFHLQYQ